MNVNEISEWAWNEKHGVQMSANEVARMNKGGQHKWGRPTRERAIYVNERLARADMHKQGG
jgi:hypothetical protein